MAQILIVRHAQSEWNAAGRWQGHADTALSEHGRAQAQDAAARLGSVDAIVASDLLRARATAEIIADASGIGPIVVDPGLRERDVGLWQGLTHEEIERSYPGALATGTRPSGWESDESLLDRVLSALFRIATLVTDGTALVVSHAGVLYMIEMHFECYFKKVGNLGGRRLLVESGEVRMKERVALIQDGPSASVPLLGR